MPIQLLGRRRTKRSTIGASIVYVGRTTAKQAYHSCTGQPAAQPTAASASDRTAPSLRAPAGFV